MSCGVFDFRFSLFSHIVSSFLVFDILHDFACLIFPATFISAPHIKQNHLHICDISLKIDIPALI